MPDFLQLRLYENRKETRRLDFDGLVQLGRSKGKDEAAYSDFIVKLDDGRTARRLVIAPPGESDVSRKHALIEPLSNGRITVKNLSGQRPIGLTDGTELQKDAVKELDVPTVLTIGRKAVRVEKTEDHNVSLRCLDERTRAPGELWFTPPKPTTFAAPTNAGIDSNGLMAWLHAAMDVLQSATCSADFFSRAATAVVNLVGLDSGRVLIREQDEWTVQACRCVSTAADSPDWRPSRTVLNRVVADKHTYLRTAELATADAGSLCGIQEVVAAPILDRHGEVIGALYGDRRRWHADVPSLTVLEARLVELLAVGVAAGLTRLKLEKEALTARVRFEQFFSKELAEQLEANPELLKPQSRNVTVLFCDIHRFSLISGNLGPERTIEWINAVLHELSVCVLARNGVLVDYVGDALMAMWGAPGEQPDHARLACLAALDMLGNLPTLSRQWESVIGQPLGLSIGINTGPAQVGNIGSNIKFKYGPLGNAVNLASRVQGATKYLKCPLVITNETHKELGKDFDTRCLCRVRMVNIKDPIDLYEIAPPGVSGWESLKETYEGALAEFDQQRFRQSARLLAGLVSDPINDGPALVLMSRAVNALVDGPSKEHPVWELPGK